MTYSDEQMLELLRQALEPAPVRPARERRQAIRSMASSESAPPAIQARSKVRRGPRRIAWAAVAVAAAAVLFAGGVLVGEDLPRPIRALAHTIGLPVESPELTDARGLLHDLGELVGSTEGDPSNQQTLDRIQSVDGDMLEVVGKLDEEEKAKIVPVAHEVHLRAQQVLQEAGRVRRPSP